MANIKSAMKRIKVTAKKTLRNKIVKSQTKTAIKKVFVAAGTGDKASAELALRDAVKVIDRAASKGVYHKNNASRKKSRLALMVNKIGA